MFLIAGLGNPGEEYAETRHNIGFKAIDILSTHYRIPLKELKCRSLIGRGRIAGNEVVLAKPLTYMNNSGEAIKCLMQKFGLRENEVLVIYDDLDLPAGVLRIRPAGGSGGHRGIESIIKAIGTNRFGRIRIGIGRPDDGDEVGYVLSPFTDEEKALMDEKLKLIPEIVASLFTRGYNFTMSNYNRRD